MILFIEQYQMSQYVKLTNRSGLHNGLQLKKGLNIDHIPFCPIGDCTPGGIYFTSPEYLENWLGYRNDLELVWEVEIPEGAQVYHEKTKSKADKLILKNPKPINEYLKQSLSPSPLPTCNWSWDDWDIDEYGYLYRIIQAPLKTNLALFKIFVRLRIYLIRFLKKHHANKL